jgi:hypothetical protein
MPQWNRVDTAFLTAHQFDWGIHILNMISHGATHSAIINPNHLQGREYAPSVSSVSLAGPGNAKLQVHS